MALRMAKLENAITHVQPECQNVVMVTGILEKYVMMALVIMDLVIVMQRVLIIKCQFVVMILLNTMIISLNLLGEAYLRSVMIIHSLDVLNSVMRVHVMDSKIQVLPLNVMLPVVALHQMNHLLQSGQMHEDELSQFAVIVEENDQNSVMKVLSMVLRVIARVLVRTMHQPVVMVSKMLENSVMKVLL